MTDYLRPTGLSMLKIQMGVQGEGCEFSLRCPGAKSLEAFPVLVSKHTQKVCLSHVFKVD